MTVCAVVYYCCGVDVLMGALSFKFLLYFIVEHEVEVEMMMRMKQVLNITQNKQPT